MIRSPETQAFRDRRTSRLFSASKRPIQTDARYSVASRSHSAVRRLMEKHWMQISTLFFLRLLLLYRYAMSVGVLIVTGPSNLPRDSHAGLSTADDKLIVTYFIGNINRRVLTNASQLIPKVLVQRFKPIRQLDYGAPASIQFDYAIVDIFHVRRFDERMAQIFRIRMQRMINLE